MTGIAPPLPESSDDRLSFPIPEPRGAAQVLRVLFAATRGDIVGVFVGDRRGKPVKPGVVYDVSVERRPGDAGSLTLDSLYAGEPPAVVRFEWLDQDKESPGRVSPLESGKRIDLDTVFDNSEEVLVAREKYIDSLSTFHSNVPSSHPNGSTLEQRLRFFLNFDRRSLPKSASPQGLKVLLYGPFKDFLKQRILDRAKRSATLANGEGDRYLREPFADIMQRIAEVFGNNFGAGSDAAGDYFESFASDEIAIDRLQGETSQLATQSRPNGPFYFMLAELAFFQHEFDPKNPHRAIWTHTLNALVRTCRIFTDQYWNKKGRRWGSYAAAFARCYAYPVARREDIRSEFEGVTDAEALESRFTDICEYAFRDHQDDPT